jgi:hypothetical protein
MSATEKVKNLDLIGGTIGITALVLINFAWNQAVVAGWEQPYVYATLIVGCFLLAVFAYYEARLSPNPLLPFAAFNSDIAFVFGCTAAGWGTFGIWVSSAFIGPNLTFVSLTCLCFCRSFTRHNW